MSEIVKGLLITAIGMGLVFVVIILLWGVMALLVKLTSGKRVLQAPAEMPATPVTGAIQPDGERSLKAKAAAVAVATLLASSKLSSASTQPENNEISNWQAQGRARQMHAHTLRGQRR